LGAVLRSHLPWETQGLSYSRAMVKKRIVNTRRASFLPTAKIAKNRVKMRIRLEKGDPQNPIILFSCAG
jgi:hypothetical protein